MTDAERNEIIERVAAAKRRIAEAAISPVKAGGYHAGRSDEDERCGMCASQWKLVMDAG